MATSHRKHFLRTTLVAAALLFDGAAQAAVAPVERVSEAAAMRSAHERLTPALAASPFRRPVVLESTEGATTLKGDVYGVIDAPYAATAAALRDREHWCELLMLHPNVTGCSTRQDPPSLSLALGRKSSDGPESGQKMDFAFQRAAGPDYLRVQLSADSGPMSTSDYQVILEVAPLDAKRSFLHLSYGYGYGTMARLATKAYLATAGRDKVGFTITGRGTDGEPVYIGGVRGMLERNVMRYYLAIESYLGALSAPPAEQAEKRLRDWYAAIERTPRQLQEVSRDEYLAIKRRQLSRMTERTTPG